MTPTTAEIEQARGLLAETPVRPANPWAGLGAALLAAVAAILLAGVMVLGPGFALKDPAVSARFEN